MMNYSVVEFVDDGAVDVVCSKWLKFTGANHALAYWPPAKKVSVAVRKEFDVDRSTWTRHKVRILYQCGKVCCGICYFNDASEMFLAQLRFQAG